MRGITRDTLTELVDRRVIWVFVGLVAIAVLVVFLTDNMEMRFGMNTSGEMDLEELNEQFGNPVLNVFEAIASILVFLSVMACSGTFPHMLERGRAEFYLSKPLTHASLLVNKLFSIWTVYGGLIFGCGLIVYLAVGLFHGIFSLAIIYLLALSLVSFFIWLSIITFFGVLTGSTTMSFMAVFLFWVAEKVMVGRALVKDLFDSRLVDVTLDTIYYVLPKGGATSDTFLTLAAGRTVHDWTPVWTTLLFSLVMLFLSVWLIKRKDY